MNARNKRTLLYVIYCIIFVAVIVGLFLIFRPSHTNDSVTKPATTSKSPAGASASRGGNTKIASNGSTSSTTQASTAKSSLNNTGPGNVVGIFVVASIAGAWFWRRKQLRNVLR